MFFNTNPFDTRVTEYLADGPSFVDVVSPEPIESFLEPESSRLYDRLVEIVGAPGSGKTTIAKLFQFNNLFTVTRNSASEAYKLLFDTLSRCGAAETPGVPSLIACRLPMEGEYRDLWELPYPDEVKSRLFFSLLQSRAILTWFRNIEDAGLDSSTVTLDVKMESIAATDSMGGTDGLAVQRRAAQVEREVYNIIAALVPPTIGTLPPEAAAPYSPFSVLTAITINLDTGQALRLHPLVMLDDAHSLHPTQLRSLIAWLSRREIPIARWLLMRFDALSEDAVLATESSDLGSGGLLPSDVQRAREITVIRMQRDEKRAEDRRRFRAMARRMCGRYLQLMPIFQRRHIRDITPYLSTDPAVPSSRRMEALTQAIQRFISNERIAPDAADDLRQRLEAGPARPLDVVLQAYYILLNRYARRRPQASLLHEIEEDSSGKPLAISSGLLEGAEIQLMHFHERPFYYGLDKIADASMENADQFLRLMRELVRELEAHAIRSRSNVAPLTTALQHKVLRRAASEAIDSWNFPESDRVRRLTDFIGVQCVKRALEPNAALGAGPNAVGILEDEFRSIVARQPRLSRVLKYGIAYNAFHLKRGHKTKGRVWCLLTLGGASCLKHGLTLTLGGFLDNVPLRRLAEIVDSTADA